jgi:hypothetical protein
MRLYSFIFYDIEVFIGGNIFKIPRNDYRHLPRAAYGIKPFGNFVSVALYAGQFTAEEITID